MAKARKALAKPDPVETIESRTDAARARVEALRAERARAALAGERFDHASLRDAEDELAALGDAAVEKVRRERAAAAESEAKRAARLRAEIAAFEDQRRAAIEEAEALARGMADAITRADEARGAVVARFGELGVRWPGGLHESEQHRRLSHGLSAVLKGFSGARWGDLALWDGGVDADDAWLDGETAITRAVTAETTEASSAEETGDRPGADDARPGGACDAELVRPAAAGDDSGRREEPGHLAAGAAEPGQAAQAAR